jgi:shikimate kinase
MPPPKLIALIGLRCSGKTSVGTELARILRWPFIDLDREIERLYARTKDARTGEAATGDSRPNPSSPTRATTTPKTPPALARPSTPTLKTAGEILQSQGEPAFRALESEALTEILRRETRCVLATGGGVVEREENRRLLAEQAVCVWLRVEASELARRMRADPTPRPSLTGEDPAREIPKLALRRDPLYAALAHTTVDGALLPPAKLAEELARELRTRVDLDLDR